MTIFVIVLAGICYFILGVIFSVVCNDILSPVTKWTKFLCVLSFLFWPIVIPLILWRMYRLL